MSFVFESISSKLHYNIYDAFCKTKALFILKFIHIKESKSYRYIICLNFFFLVFSLFDATVINNIDFFNLYTETLYLNYIQIHKLLLLCLDYHNMYKEIIFLLFPWFYFSHFLTIFVINKYASLIVNRKTNLSYM